MINAIKMDVYRMFKTRSLYVIWLIFTLAFLLMIGVEAYEIKSGQRMARNEELMQEENAEEEIVNLGISVQVIPDNGEVTLLSLTYSQISSKFLALFLVIFAVLFSTADQTSGYLKQIGGQIVGRSKLILSKAVALLLFTVLSIVLTILVEAIGMAVFLGGFHLENAANFFRYLTAATVLNYAFVLLAMALAILIRNNLISMIIVIMLTGDMMMLLYTGIEKLLNRMIGETVSLMQYTLSGRIALLPMYTSTGELGWAILLALLYSAAFMIVSCQIFRKRDLA